jgi:hypothetical protein
METDDTAPNPTPDETEKDAAASNGEPPTAATAAALKTGTRKAKAGKRASAKRGASKRKTAGAKSRSKSSTRVAQQAKYPRHSVERALRIPKAIYEQNAGNPCTVKEAAAFTGAGTASGNFIVEVSSAKKYGYFASEGGKLVLQPRARKAIAPQSDTDRVTAFREALLAAPDLSEVYNFYRGENLPDEQFFINALTDHFGIPAGKVGEFREIFDESIKAAELLDASGERPRLIDIGRDEAHRPVGGKAGGAKVEVEAGATCFVMQPFAGTLGGYYDSIFKPAIEQANLNPVRADAEIFGTGKIMDQIWRGIRAAKVLVAELTSKNPNVFYELGLAHALEKPVILISSNQEDVPFDLRHIRVILYDQADPFWGPKLIDKIADNIRSAIANPEEAIFRADEPL